MATKFAQQEPDPAIKRNILRARRQTPRGGKMQGAVVAASLAATLMGWGLAAHQDAQTAAQEAAAAQVTATTQAVTTTDAIPIMYVQTAATATTDTTVQAQPTATSLVAQATPTATTAVVQATATTAAAQPTATATTAAAQPTATATTKTITAVTTTRSSK